MKTSSSPARIFKQRANATLADRVAFVADEFLEALLLAEKEGDPMTLWNCDFHLLDDIVGETSGDPEKAYLLAEKTDAEPAVWPIDFALAAKKTDGSFFLCRTESASPKEIRGQAKMVPKYCANFVGAWLTRDKFSTPERVIVGRIGGKWVDLRSQFQNAKGNVVFVKGDKFKWHSDLAITVAIATAGALSERYEWHAAFGFSDNGPRLLIPTNPRGCLELFRSRNLNPGERRRSALRHWVKNHYRDVNRDDEGLTYVRDHLRGNTRFIWNGLDCEVLVSEYDLERSDSFKVQASEWRAMRKHNAR